MTGNKNVFRSPTALGVALLLHVVLLLGNGIVAQPVRERLPEKTRSREVVLYQGMGTITVVNQLGGRWVLYSLVMTLLS